MPGYAWGGEPVHSQTGKGSKWSQPPRWHRVRAGQRALGSQVTTCPRRAPLQREKVEGESVITAWLSTRAASHFVGGEGRLPQDWDLLRLGGTGGGHLCPRGRDQVPVSPTTVTRGLKGSLYAGNSVLGELLAAKSLRDLSPSCQGSLIS